MTPAEAQEFYSRIAKHGTVAKIQKDGIMRVVAKPQRGRDFDWHRPHTFVPELQWRPETEVNRYEFARMHTPPHQREIFQALQFAYQQGPPSLAPDRLWEMVAEAREKNGHLPNGLPGEDLGTELFAELDSYVIRQVSPDGQWSFSVQAVRLGDGNVADRLDVKHRDYRTVADWRLLVRFRSWVLPDNRTAFLIMPTSDTHYENDTPNNLQLISARHHD